MELVKSNYLDSLLPGETSLPPTPRAWLNRLRGDALDVANALPSPTTRDEEWRFTDLAPLYKATFRHTDDAAPLNAVDIARFVVPEAGYRFTFVDGHFAPHLSVLDASAGLTLKPLAAAVTEQDLIAQEHLARYVDFHGDAFAAVNTAWLQDGVFVHVGPDVGLAAPIHVLFISTRGESASYPRVLLVADRGSDCTFIEDFVSLQDAAYLVNAVTEIMLADNARVRHIRLQRENANAFHIATCGVQVGRDANYVSTSVALGARLSRVNLNVLQAGTGAQCEIDGLALIAGRQLADTHTLLDHAQPDGRSRQMHKCIAGGAAHAVFNGKIFVRKDAQRTDSSQQSRNLLLTERAHIDTKPQLEIFADDVKCAHGATVGQLDAEQMFYLTSRGFSETTARELLTFAFAAEIVERIPVPSLVQRLEETVVRQTQTRTSQP